MYWALIDSTGNLVETFDREDQARAELAELVGSDEEAAEHVALLRFDDDGNPVGEAVTAAELGAVA